jgi:hypothetical protein
VKFFWSLEPEKLKLEGNVTVAVVARGGLRLARAGESFTGF